LSGNPALGGGQDLPPPLSPAPAPTLDFSQVVQQLDAFVENGQRSLRFRVDSATGRTVMTVLDAKTEEVIRQIPAEEVLALARNLDRLQGRLIDAEA
jgi:flagellar protein FlaG